jgi:hypothetical protein
LHRSTLSFQLNEGNQIVIISVEAERAKNTANIPRAHRCAAKHVRPYVGEEVKVVLKEPILGGVPKSHQCTLVSVDATGITFSPGFGEEISAQGFGNIKQVEVL